MIQFFKSMSPVHGAWLYLNSLWGEVKVILTVLWFNTNIGTLLIYWPQFEVIGVDPPSHKSGLNYFSLETLKRPVRALEKILPTYFFEKEKIRCWHFCGPWLCWSLTLRVPNVNCFRCEVFDVCVMIDKNLMTKSKLRVLIIACKWVPKVEFSYFQW